MFLYVLTENAKLDEREKENLVTLECSSPEGSGSKYSWWNASLGSCQCNAAAEVDEKIEQGLHFTSLTEHKRLGTSIYSLIILTLTGLWVREHFT